MTLKFKFLAFILASGLNSFAQISSSGLDIFFSTLSKNHQFNGNVLIAENGKVIYEKSFGYADISSKKLNTKQTTFPIASITKHLPQQQSFNYLKKRN